MALYGGNNFTISNNVLVDNCQDIPDDDTANGCTTEISGWSNSAGDKFDNWLVYGNVIYRKNAKSTEHTDAVILGGSAASVTGWKVYNNVIAGMASPSSGGLQRVSILINGSGNQVYNNIWYDIGAAGYIACAAGGAGSSCTHNWCYSGSTAACSVGASSITGTGNPFVNYSGGDFRLTSATNARNNGKNLTGVSGFSDGAIDLYGRQRGADGSWDIGAYEFASGDTLAPLPPVNLRSSN